MNKQQQNNFRPHVRTFLYFPPKALLLFFCKICWYEYSKLVSKNDLISPVCEEVFVSEISSEFIIHIQNCSIRQPAPLCGQVFIHKNVPRE